MDTVGKDITHIRDDVINPRSDIDTDLNLNDNVIFFQAHRNGIIAYVKAGNETKFEKIFPNSFVRITEPTGMVDVYKGYTAFGASNIKIVDIIKEIAKARNITLDEAPDKVLYLDNPDQGEDAKEA